MINFDHVAKENRKDNNSNWPKIHVYPYRILITGGPGSGKRTSLFNLINYQQDIDRICLCANGPYKAKY